ncbi:hypothetical protein ACMYR3_11865 [Ampullimonas aquatilis]|uniref:hypothetical protein n=1 Tax=Ampullimonas aquatilis TaxID=1341549 RepID=UPI003C72E4DF
MKKWITWLMASVLMLLTLPGLAQNFDSRDEPRTIYIVPNPQFYYYPVPGGVISPRIIQTPPLQPGAGPGVDFAPRPNSGPGSNFVQRPNSGPGADFGPRSVVPSANRR